MFENQLLLVIRFEDHRVFIKALNPARKFDAAHQINCEECLLFPGVVQKRFLNILRKLFHSLFSHSFSQRVVNGVMWFYGVKLGRLVNPKSVSDHFYSNWILVLDDLEQYLPPYGVALYEALQGFRETCNLHLGRC
jgi:hypothetical protein